MTNQEKYADILEKMQAERPSESIVSFLGLTSFTKQPVHCLDTSCWECAWHGKDCAQEAEEWLTAVAEDDKRKEEKQMKKKCAVNFEGNMYHLLLSEEQVKVFCFLRDEGWEVAIEELEDDFKEL